MLNSHPRVYKPLSTMSALARRLELRDDLHSSIRRRRSSANNPCTALEGQNYATCLYVIYARVYAILRICCTHMFCDILFVRTFYARIFTHFAFTDVLRTWLPDGFTHLLRTFCLGVGVKQHYMYALFTLLLYALLTRVIYATFCARFCLTPYARFTHVIFLLGAQPAPVAEYFLHVRKSARSSAL